MKSLFLLAVAGGFRLCVLINVVYLVVSVQPWWGQPRQHLPMLSSLATVNNPHDDFYAASNRDKESDAPAVLKMTAVSHVRVFIRS
jgi:hypothetical protein